MIAKPLKPPGPADQFCPLVRKRCSSACQTCMWWIEVGHTAEDGKTKQAGYACAQIVVATGVHRTAHEVRHATAQTARMNNTVAKIHEQNVESNMRIIEGIKPILRGALGEPERLERRDVKLIDGS